MACSTCAKKDFQRLRQMAAKDPKVAALIASVRDDLRPEGREALDETEPPMPYVSPGVPNSAQPAPDAIIIVTPRNGLPRPQRPGEIIRYDERGRAWVDAD